MSHLDPPGLLQAFSTLTLDLQRLAQHQEIEHFQHHALARLSQLLAFDSAWWGRSAVIEGLPQEHSSCLYHLPPGYLADWQSIRHPTFFTHAWPTIDTMGRLIRAGRPPSDIMRIADRPTGS